MSYMTRKTISAPKTFTLEEAEAEAAKYSEMGYKAAVMEWFADYDMYNCYCV